MKGIIHEPSTKPTMKPESRDALLTAIAFYEKIRFTLRLMNFYWSCAPAASRRPEVGLSALRRPPARHAPMPGFDEIADPQELRRCLPDLVALSTLPATWRIYDSDRIAESAADAMLPILNCEYVLVSVPDQSIEVTKVARGVDPDAAIAVAAALREWLTHQLDDQTAISVAPNVGTLRLASGPIGLGDKAVVVAASRQTNFPTAGQHLLLQTCANYVTDELERCHSELHRRRFVALVERSSARSVVAKCR
jgi:hypothetical protein